MPGDLFLRLAELLLQRGDLLADAVAACALDLAFEVRNRPVELAQPAFPVLDGLLEASRFVVQPVDLVRRRALVLQLASAPAACCCAFSAS